MKTILIKTNGSATVREISGFVDLYDYYKGFPSTVNPSGLDRPFCMMVDDAGLLHGLPVNEFGSMLYGTEKYGNPIVGDIFLMKQKWGSDGYELVGLTDSEIKRLFQKYGLEPK